MQYTSMQVEKIKKEYNNIFLEVKEMFFEINNVQLKNRDANNYLKKGLLRRLTVMCRATENIFNIFDPGVEEPRLKDDLNDVEINLESFLINVSGCLDNIAWVYALESSFLSKNPKLSKFEIGLQKKKKLRENLPEKFREYLYSVDDWISLHSDYRDALAHNIKAYIPPYVKVKAENNKKAALPLLILRNGDVETRMLFHSQVISDLKTIKEIILNFICLLNTTRSG